MIKTIDFKLVIRTVQKKGTGRERRWEGTMHLASTLDELFSEVDKTTLNIKKGELFNEDAGKPEDWMLAYANKFGTRRVEAYSDDGVQQKRDDVSQLDSGDGAIEESYNNFAKVRINIEKHTSALTASDLGLNPGGPS